MKTDDFTRNEFIDVLLAVECLTLFGSPVAAEPLKRLCEIAKPDLWYAEVRKTKSVHSTSDGSKAIEDN